MNKFQSHKIVEAARIVDAVPTPDDGLMLKLEGEDEFPFGIDNYTAQRFLDMANHANTTINGGWLMVYPDGYFSWSPAKAFEEGYSTVQPSSGKSKIAGYRELTAHEIDAMNAVKEMGKAIGTVVQHMRDSDGLDQRWVAIGMTDLQKGLMSLTRAIAQPTFF